MFGKKDDGENGGGDGAKADADAKAGDAKGDAKAKGDDYKSKQEVIGNVFTYLYVFFSIIGIFVTVSMVLFAWLDVRELSKYQRVTRPDETMLLFKDTIEHELLNHAPRFNVFSEAQGGLNIVMNLGAHMLSILMVQVLLCIIVKIALDGGNWTDAIKGFSNAPIMIIMFVFAIQLMLVLVYYFELNRKKFNFILLGEVFQTKLDMMNDLRQYIISNMYNGPDSPGFYRRLVASVYDHGRKFRSYLTSTAKERSDMDIGKMMFTFNIFQFYISQYNTVDNFISTPMYKFFAGTPRASSGLDILQFVNVLGLAHSGVLNIFEKNQIQLWYSRMYADYDDRALAISQSWENRVADIFLTERMTVLNSKIRDTLFEFNWTQHSGVPSAIYRKFKEYLAARFLFWFITQLVVIGGCGYLVYKSLSKR